MASALRYEPNNGDVLAGLEALFNSRTDSSGNFATGTTPTDTQVGKFLDRGYWQIAALLASRGYSVSQTDTEVLGLLADFQIRYGAIQVELTYPGAGAGPRRSATGRFGTLAEWRSDLKELLETQSLDALGADRDRNVSDGVNLTGVSFDEKDSEASDSDLVPTFFSRRKLSHPDRVNLEDEFPEAD